MVRGFEWRGRYIQAMRVRDMQIFDTVFFRESMRIFNMWKRFGVLPHGRGFADERNTIVEILMILASESDAWDAWEAEKNNSK